AEAEYGGGRKEKLAKSDARTGRGSHRPHAQAAGTVGRARHCLPLGRSGAGRSDPAPELDEFDGAAAVGADFQLRSSPAGECTERVGRETSGIFTAPERAVRAGKIERFGRGGCLQGLHGKFSGLKLRSG